MKESGIDWIGEIPEHWEKKKLGWSFNLGSGTTPDSNNEKYYDGDIPWVNTGDLNDGTIKKIKKSITDTALKEFSVLKIFPKNTLIIAMYGATIGKLGILNEEATTNQACCNMYDSKDIDSKFMFYWFLANKKQIISMAQGGGQPNINQNLIKNLKLWVPKIDEQRNLVKFLEQTIEPIKNKIKMDERFIQLLKEKEQALINQTVTKGLDISVPMKDSRIEWIGEIPEHYEMKKLKWISSVTKLTGFEYTKFWKTDDKGKIMAIRGENIGFNELKKEKIEMISENLSTKLTRSKLFKGDIVFPCTGTIGNAVVIPEDNKYHINQNVAKISAFEQVDANYLVFVLLSNNIKFQTILANTSGVQPVVLIKNIRQFKIPLPPKNEQKLISSFINSELNKIDILISKIITRIQKLKEYHHSLISSAVAGKIDVRNTI